MYTALFTQFQSFPQPRFTFVPIVLSILSLHCFFVLVPTLFSPFSPPCFHPHPHCFHLCLRRPYSCFWLAFVYSFQLLISFSILFSFFLPRFYPGLCPSSTAFPSLFLLYFRPFSPWSLPIDFAPAPTLFLHLLLNRFHSSFCHYFNHVPSPHVLILFSSYSTHDSFSFHLFSYLASTMSSPLLLFLFHPFYS